MIEVLAIAKVVIILQYMNASNMFYTLNLYNILCQL